MTRRNTLLRLHQGLLARKERLGKKIAAELAYLHASSGDATGDSADLAFEVTGDEISSRLAELGDRELIRIERALAHWNQGMFGDCETCRKPIPLGRLNALPFAPFCIQCERARERSPDMQDQPSSGRWGQIADAQAPMCDPRVDISELERDWSASEHG